MHAVHVPSGHVTLLQAIGSPVGLKFQQAAHYQRHGTIELSGLAQRTMLQYAECGYHTWVLVVAHEVASEAGASLVQLPPLQLDGRLC